MEDLVTEFKRKHPWYWRRAVVLDWFSTAWGWIIDEAVWDTNDPGEPRLYGRRTGRAIDDE